MLNKITILLATLFALMGFALAYKAYEMNVDWRMIVGWSFFGLFHGAGLLLFIKKKEVKDGK